jgi:hypothetical protein
VLCTLSRLFFVATTAAALIVLSSETARAQPVTYTFESTTSPFAPTTTSGVTATDFTANNQPVQGTSGGNRFAMMPQTGTNTTAIGTFNITATQTVTLRDISFQIGMTPSGPAADLNVMLSGTSFQTFSLPGAVPASISDPGATPFVRVDFADITLNPGQAERFSFFVTADWTGTNPGVLMDNITVSPVPEPASMLAAVAAVGALVSMRRRGSLRRHPL